MGVMFAFLAGAAAAGTAALLAPVMRAEALRSVVVEVLATTFRATDLVAEAIAPVRKELTTLVEEARAKTRPAPAKVVGPPTAVKSL
jgi:hypothetical protein